MEVGEEGDYIPIAILIATFILLYIALFSALKPTDCA